MNEMPRFDQMTTHLLKVSDHKDEWLAGIAGCDRSTVARWREGYRTPSLEHLRRMAASSQVDEWFRVECEKEMRRRCTFTRPSINPADYDMDRDGDVDENDVRALDAQKQIVAAQRRVELELELRDGLGNGIGPELLRLSSEEEALSQREMAAAQYVAARERGRR